MCYCPMRLLHKTELKETILLYKLKTIVDSVVLTVRLWGPILCTVLLVCVNWLVFLFQQVLNFRNPCIQNFTVHTKVSLFCLELFSAEIDFIKEEMNLEITFIKWRYKEMCTS